LVDPVTVTVAFASEAVASAAVPARAMTSLRISISGK
jgi:hypothetical protein